MSNHDTLSIRRSRYRGQDGWLVTGKVKGRSWSSSVFTTSRHAAEQIKKRLAAEEDWTHDEWMRWKDES